MIDQEDFEKNANRIFRLPAEDAIVEWNLVLKRWPNAPLALYRRATCFAAIGDADSCVRDLRLLKNLSPYFAERLEKELMLGSLAYVDIGESRFQDGDLSQALSNFEIALKYDPRNSDSLVGIGRVKMAMKEFEQAEKLFQQARDIDGESEAPLIGLGDLFLDSKPGLAIEYYTAAIQLNPNEPYTYQQRAVAYRNVGHHDLAEEDDETLKAIRN